MDKKKPRHWRAFDQLCKRLIQVPKKELDTKIARDRKKRLKAKKQKRS